MKEKLIELLLSAEKVADEEGFCNCHKSRPKAELIADYLIQNGVLVPPCKVGDTVYAFCEMLGTILEYKVVRIELTAIAAIYEAFAYTEEEDVLIDTLDFEIDDIGKTVFLTKEEVENKLKECENETNV